MTMIAQPSDSRIDPSMSPLVAEVMQTIQALPLEQQQQVLDFVQFLEQKLEQNRSTQSRPAGTLSRLKQIKIHDFSGTFTDLYEDVTLEPTLPPPAPREQCL